MTLPQEDRVEAPWDVIVVGAGPAGCVLASRLSEQTDRRVLLIEAGPDAVPGREHPDILDPFPLSTTNNAFHWPGLFVEKKADLANGAALVAQPYIKGYGVGGGSNINGMGADRGQPGDYDAWRDLGAADWGWDQVLPYFRKLERDLDFSSPSATTVHGKSGPMPVRRLPRAKWAPFAAAMADALARRGFPLIDDYMTDFREGLSGAPTNSLHQRVSTSMAYLTRDVRRRPNLTILANARVNRIHIEGRRATAADVAVDGTSKRVFGREVILCCGAIQSPAVLMRSGIGPGAQLSRHRIEVICDRRGVGRNLQNHPSISLPLYLPRRAFQPADNPWFLQNWLRFSSHYPGCAENDMHLMPFNRTAWHALGTRVGMVTMTVMQSFSKGTVELESADPTRSPYVRFNLLSDSRDFERLVSALRFVLELLREPIVAATHKELFFHRADIVANLARRSRWNGLKARALASILDYQPVRRILLAGSRIDPDALLNNEIALREFVRCHAGPQLHDCGTCRMGRADDPDAVVNGGGQVYGIHGLRVVDASIFPTVPRGYPHFIVIMMAEKIADAVKADWESSCKPSSILSITHKYGTEREMTSG